MLADASNPHETLEVASTDGARIRLCRHGGHLLSARTASGHELLYLSEKAIFEPGAAIRGGVPIIFPQFSDHGSLPKHGFARTAPWTLVRAETDAHGPAVAELTLRDDERTRALWPQAFEASVRVRAYGEELEQTLTVQNPGDGELRFTAALHTYLAVDDLAAVHLRGLEGRSYRDSADGGRHVPGNAVPIVFGHEVDRIYPHPLPIDLEDGRAHIAMHTTGFGDWVVWNPGPEKARNLTDVEPDGWRRFVCVEAARITEPVVLEPGQSWSGVCVMAAGPGGS